MANCRIATYHGDDFRLKCLVQGDQTQVENEVELRKGLARLVGCHRMQPTPGLRRTEETRRRTEMVC